MKLGTWVEFAYYKSELKIQKLKIADQNARSHLHWEKTINLLLDMAKEIFSWAKLAWFDGIESDWFSC